MEISSLLEAFRGAGDVAFNCRYYLEYEQAIKKDKTTQAESFLLLLTESDDDETRKGAKTLLLDAECSAQQLPAEIKAGYSRFIGFVETNGGDKGIDFFFQNVKNELLAIVDSQTREERRLYAYRLIEPVQVFAMDYLCPYYEESYSYFRVLYTDEETHEEYLKFLCYMVRQYVNVLDAVLLMKGDDLLEIQEDMDIHVLPERNVICLSSILGGINTATAYINALPTRQNEPQQEAPEFPDELNTPEAKKLIGKAVEAGFITVEEGRHTWNATKVLLAYFAFKATRYLKLRTIADATVSWKPFEDLFQVSHLKQAKADYGKYDEDFKPLGRERLNPLFEG